MRAAIGIWIGLFTSEFPCPGAERRPQNSDSSPSNCRRQHVRRSGGAREPVASSSSGETAREASTTGSGGGYCQATKRPPKGASAAGHATGVPAAGCSDTGGYLVAAGPRKNSASSPGSEWREAQEEKSGALQMRVQSDGFFTCDFKGVKHTNTFSA